MSLVAIAAIDGLVAAWLEGDLGLIATTGAGDGVHLACFVSTTTATTIPTTGLSLACSAAGWAAAGGVRQLMAGVKLLLANCENEFLVAVAAT